ncbi:transcription elongation factor Spt6 [Ascodesmis nigricans]|uniref:Transcription elongation factor Spt6 n=1 Tax=Ascodesmis nigricans TaxID=341454 RepID=A0A4S2MVA1_9PEZI|nr:transcription elongation factor Spt6 [Ascodesmis nigricans]
MGVDDGSSRKRRKRRRSQREEEEDDDNLDDEDLDLVMENTGEGSRSTQSKFKRLKQRGRDDGRPGRRSRDLEDIFSDDEADGAMEDDEDRGDRRRDEMEDFIENDYSDEEGGQAGSDDEMRIRGARRVRDNRNVDFQGLGLSENALADMQDIFALDDYEDDLVLADETEQMEEQTRELQLKDVFEPSELAERLLTDEDQEIRQRDIPERLQLIRKPFKGLELSPEEVTEEVNFVSGRMYPRMNFKRDLKEPFTAACRKVLHYINVDNYEVPFIYQQRRDYLIYTEKVPRSSNETGELGYTLRSEKMLAEKELWQILDLDTTFRAFIEKRNNFKRVYQSLKDMGIDEDPIVESQLAKADAVEQIQDLHDYVHFRYAAQLRDVQLMKSNSTRAHRRPGGGRSIFEKIRDGRIYSLVRAFGITAEQYATNVSVGRKREFAEDPDVLPEILAEQYVDPPECSTGNTALDAAKAMLAQEIFHHPAVRNAMRLQWFVNCVIHVNPTEKGVKQIDDQHQYYEFKYLRNQTAQHFAEHPELFLKMCKAEQDGLIEMVIEIQDYKRFLSSMHEFIISDNYSENADAWNRERKQVVDIAMDNFAKMFKKSVKDEVKSLCESEIQKAINYNFTQKLDQAPYKPKGLTLGEIPRVFAVSNGHGVRGKDAIVGVFMDEDGRVTDHIKVDSLREEQDKDYLAEQIRRRRPDVIGIAGFSVQTHYLCNDLRKLVADKDLTVTDDDDERSPIEVVYVNDEVARLYQNSERAKTDHPDFPPLARYCAALGRYLQNPLLEYVALGKDITSISFHPVQTLLDQDKVKKALETALVDIVNLVGIDINDAVKKPYIANLLPYICGLGPRKASGILKTIGINGGKVTNRQELLGIAEDGARDITPAMGVKVFENCASYIIIQHDPRDIYSDFFDGTRVHPEEYDLGRKMAADALDYDEEDINDAISRRGKGAVVNDLVKGRLERLHDLILEEYAEELERNFKQKKRAILESIRGELMTPYEELRARFMRLTPEEIFTMLTGETAETLRERMVVPVNIRRVNDRSIQARLDCGIEGNIPAEEMPMVAINARPSYYYHIGQTVQARIETLDTQGFYCELSLREEKINQPRRRILDLPQEEWDEVREERDKARLAVKNQEETRTARVIKHPLFKPFNSRQAEEFLSGQSRGDAVIRPSSNGPDHIAVTWKVADGIYQHLDVLELDKANEFTIGRVLRVSGKFNYSDLDELIVNHVKAMAKKVDELVHNPKFQSGSKEDAMKWLEKYCEANPKRSSYAFCLDPKQPGYFVLLFKAGKNARMGCWYVKVVPGAFQLKGTTYPDVITLCNGFKTMHTHMTQRAQTQGGGRPRI